MWPMLLDMTLGECRRTLRSLELETYSHVMSVFRAQGALEDNRKKLLEELRAVLHISHDRHTAEARRVSNDELLATIAEQLAGPNTNFGWIREGRRIIPLLPRGIPQTMYTEFADKIAKEFETENKEIQKRLESEKMVAPKTDEEEMQEAEGQTAEVDMTDESLYPPIAMEDQSIKLWETELVTRKRKVTEGIDDVTTPVKSMRNIPVNDNQKHLNLSKIYSKYSQTTSKPSGQSKHSYNQVSKIATSKSGQPSHAPHKHRQTKRTKNPAPIIVTKTQAKKQENIMSSPSKYTTALDYGNPNSFQATYAQSVLGSKMKPDYMDDLKAKVLSSPGMVTDSPTMQLLTQPATLPHEIGVAENPHPDDPTTLQAQSTPGKHTVTGKPCHLIIKNKGDIISDKKLQMSDMKVTQKASEGIKLISNRQVVVASSSAQKALHTPGKLIATKVIGSLPKSRSSNAPIITDKMIVVSKPSERPVPNSKILITSSMQTPQKMNNAAPRTIETFTPKGIPATDLKVSAKTVVLNSKSGQKMVVLPAKARTKQGGEGQIPILPLHFKGISPGMKLVPVSSHPATHPKSSTVTVVSKPSPVTTISSKKIVGVEPIKTANLADIVPAKSGTPISTPKITNPIVRPVSAKGSVIVLQKGATIGKALSFTKNGNDMSKIIMGKNVNQLLQASKSEDSSKCAGNVIVLELNNEQSGRSTTMSEILDSRASRPSEEPKPHEITQDTPVLFESQIAENTNSLDSTTESIGDIVDDTISKASKSFSKDSETAKDSSSVTDWEMDLEPVTRKGKDDEDKLNSLHLDLGMSSDSEGEYLGGRKPKDKRSQESIQATPSGESVYTSSSGLSLATRTLLSQLQDEGSSSNDSSFALKAKGDKKESEPKIEDTDALTKAKEKLSEKVAEARQRRIDLYSTAISSTDINLDFPYLEEGIMAGDDEERPAALDEQLSRLLGEDADLPLKQ